MRRLVFAIATWLLCSIGIAAEAATYLFQHTTSSGQVIASGFFVIGNGPAEPGYQAITGLTFQTIVFQGVTYTGSNSWVPNGNGWPAFNPATGDIRSQYNGTWYDNFGGYLQGTPLTSGSNELVAGNFSGGTFTQAGSGNFFQVDGLRVNGQSKFQNPVQTNLSITQAVPEPSAWIMMILGLGIVGYSLRRAKEQRFAPPLAAA